jgi:flavin-dependent dehydrogenase
MFGFKGRFRNSALKRGFMPLVAFPGGYGGMVHTDDDTVNLSVCVRRDQLGRLRGPQRIDAGDAVEAHILATCEPVRRALEPASRLGPWQAAGPIRPGMRLYWPAGIFAVGNAAGEAHPAVGEGISMAIQSAWLLADHLAAWRAAGGRGAELPRVAWRYAWAWRRAFGPRMLVAAAVVRWLMSPRALTVSLPLLGRIPQLLTWGALASGKTKGVVRSYPSPAVELSAAT